MLAATCPVHGGSTLLTTEPASANGSIEEVVSAGIEAGAAASARWVQIISSAFGPNDSAGVIGTKLERLEERMTVADFANAAGDTGLHGAMLGVLDSETEEEDDELIEIETFAARAETRLLQGKGKRRWGTAQRFVKVTNPKWNHLIGLGWRGAVNDSYDTAARVMADAADSWQKRGVIVEQRIIFFPPGVDARPSVIRDLSQADVDRFAAAAVKERARQTGEAVRSPDVPKRTPGFAGMGVARAVEAFDRRKPVPRATFDQMTAQQRAKAFTIANAAKTRIIDTAKRELIRQVAQGAELRDFRRAVAARLESAGWTPANKSHVETIFRTNVVSAYASGRIRQQSLPEVRAARPLWQIRVVGDARTRQTHRAVKNLILLASDPFWERAYPPFGYNCRCRVVTRRATPGVTITSGASISGLPDPGFSSGRSAILAA